MTKDRCGLEIFTLTNTRANGQIYLILASESGKNIKLKGRSALLSFAAEFPVTYSGDHSRFVDLIKEWILGSPHTDFVSDDFSEIESGTYWSRERGNDKVEFLIAQDLDNKYFGVRRVISEPNIIWTTTIVMHQADSIGWIGVRVYRESLQPLVHVPAAKKPIILRLLLENFGGSSDGELHVQKHPHNLQNDDIQLASRIMAGEAGCYLPAVYISCNFRGNYDINPTHISSDLAGIAHVVVEPNRAFSRRLQIESESYNAYGGSVGVYWPDSSIMRSVFRIKDYWSYKEMRQSIIDDIRNALVNRRPMKYCTWLSAQEIAIRQRIDSLRSSESDEVKNYIALFDEEIILKNERIEEAEREIRRLKGEIGRHEKNIPVRGGIKLNPGNEQNFFESEIAEIVYEAILDASARVVPNGRRHHVLESIISANAIENKISEKKEELKKLLRNYNSMNADMRRNFEKLGFSISEEGKHYKAIYYGDQRYTFSIPKTPSDHRSSLNMVSDIGKKIF